MLESPANWVAIHVRVKILIAYVAVCVLYHDLTTFQARAYVGIVYRCGKPVCVVLMFPEPLLTGQEV